MSRWNTRRDFLRLAASGALGVAGVRGASPSTTPNQLKPLPAVMPLHLPSETQQLPRPLLSSTQGQDSLDKLMGAYDVLWARDPQKDPTSLKFQMWLHDFYCTDGPNDVHSTWAFLPWHRAFLYFHERILRSILGDSFRLPVWDWEKDEHVPAAYETWALSNLRKHDNADLGGLVKKCSIEAWLYSSNYNEFAGYPADTMQGKHSVSGNAPQGPHSYVHARIGGYLTVAATAAGDPLFYAHHANVDRFWRHWSDTQSFKIPAGFSDQVWYFYDELGQPRYVRSGDFRDERRLGYYYAKPAGLHPLSQLASKMIASPADALEFFKGALTKYFNNPLSALTDGIEIINAGLKTLGSGDLMLPLAFRWESSRGTPGKYYLIALKSGVQGDKERRVVAGFGIFGHAHGTVTATGCVTLDDLRFILKNPGFQIVYGPASGNMTLPEPEWPIDWPANLTILRS